MVAAGLGPLGVPAFAVLDPRFVACVVPDAQVERVWTGGRWVEGPAWLPERGLLVWSDIPGDRMLSYAPATGMVATFRHPANSPNGSTVDRAGRLVTCEQTTHRIVRQEPDGSLTALVDGIGGRRFHSPNDVVVKSDGTVWFTDPTYGRAADRPDGPDVEGCHVYRFDPATGSVRQMTEDFVMPNGLAFSPDESLLYIVDTGSTHAPDGPNHVRRFRVGPDGDLTGGEVLADNPAKQFDGLRVDTEGRLWMGAEDGVHCYLPDGTRIGQVLLPERAANLTFGGAERDVLMMTATTSVYLCRVNARGAAP
ncbi:SMP-30/gluconolactonase/LRE family protein [Kaistia adipata]|uniref:SMP-30/gluconolactonase/LRE family protein n=1 Tax=Kaistia adipata TaxID=166954 RepID=UPI00041678CB|nr:SMP-30/gluconolactonase/LRE family protein [Kaistia adipata]